MQPQNFRKLSVSKATAMEMRRMSLIKPLPSAEVNKSQQKTQQPTNTKTKILDILNGLPYNIFITIVTFYVLFADDFRQIFFPISADLPFSVVVIILMVIYLIQILVSIYARNDYFLSFFFWLDLISTGTMVFDLMWINVGGSAGIATNIVQIARAGKASRIGARSARMIRIVKLIKTVQEYKTAKQEITSEQGKVVQGLLDGIQKKGQGERGERPQRRRGLAVADAISAQKMVMDSPEHLHQQMMKRAQDRRSSKQVRLQTYSQIIDVKQTRVGIKLKQSMQTNTTMMIMLVLVSVPLLSSTTWFQETSIYQDSINQLDFFMNNSTDILTKQIELDIFINMSVGLRNSLVFLEFPINTTCCSFPKDYPHLDPIVRQLQQIRASSTMSFQMGNVSVIYDSTPYDIFTSQLNIGRTLFVCILLVFSSLFFSQDVQDYLLSPLENMLVTVKRIGADPLKSTIAMQNEKLIKQSIKTEVNEQQINNQPAILENMILKIGALLVVGFGQAGSEIIAKNIQAHGAINPVLSGTKMIAIFGFCDIRNFTDATQVLQTGVMDFVNDVAEIVHGVVYKCCGSANKNIGDAFLLVWKFKQKQVFLSDSNGKTEVTLRRIKKVAQMADLSVYSFMKIIAQLTKAPKLLKYTNNKSLKQRIPNFTGVKMGFGLHVGWAIEGAIGSSFKIDASYLSPNVNMASRLQAATKQFGVFMLISGNLVQLMTNPNKKLLRLIDRVTVKGSIEPIDFYTLDICVNYPQQIGKNITITNSEQKKPKSNQILKVNNMQKKKQKMFAHKTREAILNSIETGKNVTQRIFTNDKDFQKMRQPYSVQFFKQWEKGYEFYIKGLWSQAKECFQNTLKINSFLTDGPSNTLLKVIQSYNGQAPQTWQGFRELTQK